MELTFDVDGKTQTITRTDGNAPVADTVKYLKATFNVSNMPDMKITPLFWKYGNAYTPELTQTGTDTVIVVCEVPATVISSAQFEVSCFGYNATSGERITVPKVSIPVLESGYSDGNGVPIPSKTIYEQILDEINAISSGKAIETAVIKAVDDYMDAKGTKILSKADVEQIVSDYCTAHKADLKGDNGKSAYEIAVANGYSGTMAEWLASLKGSDGYSPSVNAQQTSTGTDLIITDKSGTTKVSVLNGTNGSDGKNGSTGKDGTDGYSPSAKVESVSTGATISITDKTGTTTATILNGTNGTNGANGKSAYELAVSNGFSGTESEWLASLKGTNGTNGTDGTSPTIVTNSGNNSTTYKLDISDKNGTFTTPNLKGADGSGGSGTSGMSIFHATYTVSGWTASSDSTSYSQSQAITGMTATTQLMPPSVKHSGTKTTDAALDTALNIINAGLIDSQAGSVSIKVWEKPATDIDIYWLGKETA